MPAAKPPAKAAVKAPAQTSPIDAALVRALAEVLDETSLTEIEVSRGDLKIRVARQVPALNLPPMMPMGYAPPPGAGYAMPPATPVPAAAVAPVSPHIGEGADPAKHPGAVTSPMVGTAYRAAEPGAKPFVEIGTRVAEGQTLLIIEAMKTMNAIPAPRAGTVTQVLFDDASPVEYGEALLILE
jgi:acetyl-CoA carboxylase biotin carboxyl carrier protein